jgi:nitrogen fixation NifU-like protein
MTDLRDLYQQVILDHNRKPKNFHALPGANRKAQGYNPLCGDQLTVYAKVEDGVIRDVAFEGSGCAISKASASMMTDGVAGKSEAEAERLFELFHAMVTGEGAGSTPSPELGKLAVFSGVCEFPARVKCASLAWHTLRAAMKGSAEPVSTE